MKIAIIAGIRGRPGDLPKLKGNSKTNIFTAELAEDFRQMSAHQNHLAANPPRRTGLTQMNANLITKRRKSDKNLLKKGGTEKNSKKSLAANEPAGPP